MCTLPDFQNISLCQAHNQCIIGELEDWHKFYIPDKPRSIQLDIGAGCGETAFFYLSHGVKHVVCIEGNKNCLENLYKNYGNDDRVTIVPYFVENIKIDIDGGEKGMILETHFPHRLKHLKHVNLYTDIQVLEQYWGNPLKKAIRKFAWRMA